MSKLEGGIFSRPRGKTGGIVFGAARTRRGKQVTTRLLVPPSNPKTAAQQAQRGAFADTLKMVKAIGPDVYQKAFNRTVSQLAGFQSMMSLLMNQYSASNGWVQSGDRTILRGSNPLPANITFGGGSNPFEVTWDATPKAGGLATDEVHMVGYINGSPEDAIDSLQVFDTLTIGDGATGYSFSNPGDDDVVLFLWTVGSGANAGVFSNILWGDDIFD